MKLFIANILSQGKWQTTGILVKIVSTFEAQEFVSKAFTNGSCICGNIIIERLPRDDSQCLVLNCWGLYIIHWHIWRQQHQLEKPGKKYS